MIGESSDKGLAARYSRQKSTRTVQNRENLSPFHHGSITEESDKMNKVNALKGKPTEFPTQNCAAVCFTMRLTTLARCRPHRKQDRVEPAPRTVRFPAAL